MKQLAIEDIKPSDIAANSYLLSSEQKSIVTLRESGDKLTFKEIGGRIGISAQRAYTQYNSAVRLLRHGVGAYGTVDHLLSKDRREQLERSLNHRRSELICSNASFLCGEATDEIELKWLKSRL